MHWKKILLVAALLCLSASAFAGLIDVFQSPISAKVDAGQTVFLGSKTTGIQFTNLSQFGGFVTIEVLDGPPRQPGDEVAEGFELLDGTLRITSNIPDGEKRVRVRMGYAEERLGRAGLRAGSQRLFRRIAGRRRARWANAVRAIRGRATIRRFPGSAPIRALGHHGFDATDNYVWAFLDVTSDYAVAARTVAEPTSMALMLGGLGLVLWGGRKS